MSCCHSRFCVWIQRLFVFAENMVDGAALYHLGHHFIKLVEIFYIGGIFTDAYIELTEARFKMGRFCETITDIR